MFAILSLSLLTYGQAPDQQPEFSKTLKQLEGTWRLVGGEEAGRSTTAEEAKKEQEVFTFKDDSLVIRHKGRVRGEWVVRVKPGKEKGEIDFKHKGGRYDSKTCHAIYLLEGDTLKICTASKMRADMVDERPTVFSTKKKEDGSEKVGTLLFILKRDKK